MQTRCLAFSLLLFLLNYSLLGVSQNQQNEKIVVPNKNQFVVKDTETTEPQLKKKYKGKYADDLMINTEEAKKDKSVLELTVMIKGLDSLIKLEKNEAKRMDLIFSKGSAYLNMGKNYRLSLKQGPTYKEKEVQSLNNAIKMAVEIEKSKHSDNVLKAKAFHLHGLALLYLHNEAGAVSYFESAIATNKTATVNARLSVFIAEYLFDKEKYQEALPKYSEYFSQLSQEEKAMVIYKSAWCFSLLKQYENAEKAFLKIIGKPWAGDFAVDALRDLAYTATSHMKEQELIDFAKANLTQKNSKNLVDFLTEAYMVYLKQSGNIDRTLLYNEILKMESRGERKIALTVKKMSSLQKEYASEQPFSVLFVIEKLLQEYKIKPESEDFKYFGSELENETLKLSKGYADTVAKKVKTPEKIDDSLLSSRLDQILWFHINWFPESPKIIQSYHVSLDNCLFQKNLECTRRVSRIILKNEKIKMMWERARFELIAALDKLAEKDPKMREELYEELKWFSVNQEVSPKWTLFSKKLTAMYMEDKRYGEAFPLLEKIHIKEPTQDNLYRKLYCAFNLGMHSTVFESMNSVAKDGTYFQELQSMGRESSLQLAQEAIKKNEFEKYESYLAKFMGLNPEADKADLAKADYYQRLIDRNQIPKLRNLLITATPQSKFMGVYVKITKQLIVQYLKLGQFSEAHSFLAHDSKFGDYPEFNSFWLRAMYAVESPLPENTMQIFSQFKTDEKNSALGLLTLTKPTEVIRYYSLYPPKDEKEKKILLLSYQIKDGQYEVELSTKQVEILKSILPPELLNIQSSPSEKLSLYIEFPNPNWSDKKLEKIMPDAVARVRAIRPQVLRDVKGRSFKVQKRILTKALSNENKMLDFFNGAKVPQGLSPDNVESYKAELAQAALEFSQQADEFKKMIEGIELKMLQLKSDELTVPPDMNKWPKPYLPLTTLVESHVNNKNFFGALVVLETQRVIENLSPEDYHKLRSFVILSQGANQMLAHYVEDELKAAHQDALLAEWRALMPKIELSPPVQSDDKKESREIAPENGTNNGVKPVKTGEANKK